MADLTQLKIKTFYISLRYFFLLHLTALSNVKLLSSVRIDFGAYLLELRTNAGFSQKKVADKLGIDISLLSKIEHGERFIQSHMLKGISELFNLSFKKLQIAFLKDKIDSGISSFPYAHEAIEEWLKNSKKTHNEKA